MNKMEVFLVAVATILVIVILSMWTIHVDTMTNEYANFLAYEKKEERQFKKLSQER